jgi:uncharacterized membrane protein
MARLWNPKIFVSLLVIDLLWINVFFKDTFGNMIKKVQGSEMQVNVMYALVAYMLLYFLAVIILPKISKTEAFLLGMFTYGVYDFTNLATLKNWDLRVALVDTIWGGVLFYALKHLE